MKFQHVADVAVEFYSCATCLKGVQRRLNSTKIHQYLRSVCRKIALLKSLNFATSKEPNSHIFLRYRTDRYQNKRNFVIYKVTRGFFFNFRILIKDTPSEISVFQAKKNFSKKKYNSKTKVKSEKKNSLLFYRAQNSASIDILINCVQCVG